MSFSHKKFVRILRISCALLFLGRGWQHFFWDAPFRTFFWNEELLSGVVEGFFNTPWKDYVTSSKVDNAINFFTKLHGIFYFFMALISLTINESYKRLGLLLPFASLVLFILSFFYFAGRSWQIGMLIEHAIQFGIPTVLYLAIFHENSIEKNMQKFKALIALTFIGHGLYAFGFHPMPGHFIDMVINITGANENLASIFLKCAGSLDFLVSILIFIPSTALYALSFNIVWGLATALARILAHVDPELMQFTSHQWWFETCYRLPHGLFPLALYLFLVNSKSASEQK